MANRYGLVLPRSARGLFATASGLAIPQPRELDDAEHPAIQYINTFVTHEELTGHRIEESEIVATLQQISAYDCLQVIGRISCMVNAAPRLSVDQQLQILIRMGWEQEFQQEITRVLGSTDEGARVLFFPQQLVHLARLVIQHADDRSADNFKDGELVKDFASCLLGVSDLLEEGDLDETRVESIVPWIIRQSAINESNDSMLLWTRYYDVLIRTWDKVSTDSAFDVAEAFRRYTSITLQDWLTIGFALYGRFLNYGAGNSEDYFVEPKSWFKESALGEEVWQPFLQRNVQTLENCRASLAAEEERYGPTEYRCQTIETRPLLDFGDGRFIPMALDSLERRSTEGMFFELADGAINEGLPREEFTGPFGEVFEEFVQRSLERMLPKVGVPRVHRPREYTRDGKTVESTDAVVDLAGSVAFVEVVARRPTVATLTRGNFQTFEADLESGVLKKARQLHLNIEAYQNGSLTFEELGYAEGQEVWPLLVMIEGFPIMPPIPSVITQKIEERGWLEELPPLGILSAEDLAIMESLLLEGFSLLELLEGWRAEGMRDLPFQNYLHATGDEKIRTATRAPFFIETWEEFTTLIVKRIFPDSTAPHLGQPTDPA